MNLRQVLAPKGMLGDVARLVSGTLGGRIIALVVLPLTTRLFSPEDFALLAVYLSLVGMIAVVACFRLDVAIPIAADESEAVHLLALALGFAVLVALIVLIAVLSFPDAVSSMLGQPALAPWLWLVPMGILMSASYSALQFWATRIRRFGSIAVTRLTQAATGAIVTLSFGWAGVAPLGLLLGNMLNSGAGSLRLGYDFLRYDRGTLAGVSVRGLRAAFRGNRRFPLYSVPESLANMAGMQIPVLIVAAHAGAEAGYLLLAQQIMAAPMALLGQSIAQVYVSRAPEALREGRLADLTGEVLRRLMQIGLLPLVLAGLAAPLFFPLIFGAGWGRSGEIVAWMVPWTVLQFLASPVSMVMLVTNKQQIFLALTLIGAVLRIGFTSFAVEKNNDLILSAFIGSSALYYGLCLLIFAHTAGLIWKGRVRWAGLALGTTLIGYIIVAHIIIAEFI